MSGFEAGTSAAAKLLRDIADAKESRGRGGLGTMFADQSAADLRAAAERVEAIAPPVNVSSEAAVLGPDRHMDEIDAAHEVGAWLDKVALSLPRIPNEQITLEEKDAGVKVYWRENKPHALVLTIRDGLNFTFGMGFDLSRLATLTQSAASGGEKLTTDGAPS